jgi:hypothetical protein
MLPLFNRPRPVSFAPTICEAFMRSKYRGTLGAFLGAFLAICLALPASAQSSVGQPAPNAAEPVLTGKERLGRKWMDEQRIDNCNVPIDKRGTKPRLGACPHAPTG